ncbi:MAG: NlpC/P60 family protein [Bacteroidetes bacterium]|nr:MAG: NlpC/P60 family protein [Bacteroidota bacterium]
MFQLRLFWLPILFAGLLLTACDPSRRVQRYSYLYENTDDPPRPRTRPTVPIPEDDPGPLTPAGTLSASEARVVVRTALSYQGTRYKYGGMSRRGMDCSGLVCTAYSEVGRELPRASAQMAKQGKKVSRSKLQPGHLVFFSAKNGLGIDHVGLVVKVKGKHVEFVHASTSQGVRVDSLDDPYWDKRFRKAVAY